jgi:hypothetical protein
MNPALFYFTRFDLFAEGLLGFAVLLCMFFIFSYFTCRGKVDKPEEKAIKLLLPSILIGFFLNLFGFPPLIVGILVILTYVVASKKILELDKHEWATNSITILILLGILGSIDITSRWILFILFLGFSIFSSEKRINDKKKKD